MIHLPIILRGAKVRRSCISLIGAFLVTLIVSLRTLDGIVIAGDSLSTLMRGDVVQGDVDVTCPACGHQHVVQATLQGPALPATTLSYAQKVFPFLDNYGVGTYRAGQVGGRTIYFAARVL